MRGETGRETSPVNTLLLKQEGLQLAEAFLKIASFLENWYFRENSAARTLPSIHGKSSGPILNAITHPPSGGNPDFVEFGIAARHRLLSIEIRFLCPAVGKNGLLVATLRSEGAPIEPWAVCACRCRLTRCVLSNWGGLGVTGISRNVRFKIHWLPYTSLLSLRLYLYIIQSCQKTIPIFKRKLHMQDVCHGRSCTLCKGKL